MGRTPRLVNPDDGPLQAFAHDLRRLREKAGNPTYRALAKTAGFSASTLGEAAGGVRRPSLDVTLAFVGACGGDVEAWQERWHQLDRQLTAARLNQGAQPDQADQEREARTGPGTDVRTGEGTVIDEADADEPAVDEPVLSEPVADEAPAPFTSVQLSGTTAAVAADDSPVAPPAAADLPSTALHPEPARPAETTPPAQTTPSSESVLSSEPASSSEPVPPSEPVPSSSPAPQSRRRHHRRAAAAVAALATAAVLGFIGLHWSTGPASASTRQVSAKSGASASASPHCVVPGPKGLFSGDTRGSGARIRTGASMADDVARTIGPYCELQFDGYCLGDVVADPLGGTPDMRWFEVSGGGVVSSAVIHGNPPADLKPSTCPDSVPAPDSIALSVTGAQDSPGAFELHATGTHVWIVGFATAPDDRSGAPVPETAKWQQIGMVGSAASGFSLAWSARPSGAATPATAAPRTQAATDRVPIVAVACYGGQGPTDVMDAESVNITEPNDIKPLTLTAAQRVAAADAACSYPRP